MAPLMAPLMATQTATQTAPFPNMIHFSCPRRPRSLTISILAALFILFLGSTARGGQADAPAVAALEQGSSSAEGGRFPVSTALAEGLSPEGLESLDALVAQLVADDEVVGAELMVIRNGRTVLHSAHGWRDREGALPMETGSLFCVRSMTKPLVGVAVHQLVEDKALKLRDRVADYLPAFDVDGKREITVQQLLQHTSGLPMSEIMTSDPRELTSIRAVADLGGASQLEFEPGTGFRYSDQGTDTLTALVEIVSGQPAEAFIQARILDPLGMDESRCLLTPEHLLDGRSASKYAGSAGHWNRYWQPSDGPLFPVFLGSQALYSTVEDYARFLDMLMARGRGPDGRLLKSSSVRRITSAGPHPMVSSTGLPGAETGYGSLMQLWTQPAEKEGRRDLVAFGHTGSDGTYAWAFPEQKTMVLYFTQSRGNVTGLRLEEVLGELLLGVPFDPIQAAPPLEPYLGYYFEGEGDRYRSIIRDGDGLALEILGRAVVPLVYVGDDRWKLKPNPANVIAFDRDAGGAITGYHIGEHQEFKFTPSKDLPSIDAVCEGVQAFHRMDLLEGVGPLRLEHAISMPKLKREGTSTSWLGWPNRWRSDESMGEDFERISFDGEQVWTESSRAPRAVADAERTAQLMGEAPQARFGDWREAFPGVHVVQQIVTGSDEVVLLVRAGDTSGPAPTFYVEAESLRLGRIDDFAAIPGVGRLGREITFRSFREVEGMQLPDRVEVQLANPMIGKIMLELTSVTAGAPVVDGVFRLEADPHVDR